MRSLFSRSRHPLAAAIALALTVNAVQAATIAPTSLSDTDPSATNTCTLRQAVVTLASGTKQGNCENSSGNYGYGQHDTIDLTAFGGQTFSLTTGQLSVINDTAGLTIDGNHTIIDAGNNSFRVLDVDSSNLTLNSMTIQHGYVLGTGGGIYLSSTKASASLTLNNSTVTGNSANTGGGLGINAGTGAYAISVALSNTSIIGNYTYDSGGGISDLRGTVTLMNSVVSGNTAVYRGGGIYGKRGLITGSYDTISANSVNTVTANIGSKQYGGGIFASSDTLSLANSLISANSTTAYAAGIASYAGSVELTNCTVTANSASHLWGAVFLSNEISTSVIQDSTIAGNTAAGLSGIAEKTAALLLYNSVVGYNTAGDCDLYHARITAINSLIVDSANTCGITNTNGNIVGVNPKLAPLQHNGGPTLTMALLPGSPAIDAGNNSLVPMSLTNDQRGYGFPRIFNGTVDMGAFELSDEIFRNGFESSP